MQNTLSLASAYGGNVISHQETNKATTMAVTLVTELQNFICPYSEFVSRRFFFGKADFFSAKRLFFRAARDVSGAHSEPPWARVEIKLKMSFQALSHSPSHERAKALTSPPPDFLFSSIPQSHHPTIPPNKNTKKKCGEMLANSKKSANFALAKGPSGGMVDAHVSGACAARREGSSPFLGTFFKERSTAHLHHVQCLVF